jgi:hypothetical protein
MEQIKEIIPDTALSATSLSLLGRLRAKTLSIENFMRECAFWALRDGFDELRPKPYPTRPVRATELENMPLNQRLKLDYDKFYAEFPQIREYYEQRLYIRNWNKAALEWLNEIKRHIPEEDIISHKRIVERILEFRAMEDNLTQEQ